jgi:NitT/TauT family transport system substrate-binding protein
MKSKRFAGLLMALALVVSGCGGNVNTLSASDTAQGGTPAPKEQPNAPVKVRVGNVQGTSDAGAYIALEKGYFKEQAIDIEFVPFDSGTKMVAPLGAGQLDVGAGNPSAGLYNAINRGIHLKIVADKGRNPKGFGYETLMISKANEGKLKKPSDFKGKKVSVNSVGGGGPEAYLAKWLASEGMTIKDVNLVAIPFPSVGQALKSGAVDLAVSIEPSVTLAVTAGDAVILQRQDAFYPEQQLAVLMYSEQFAKNGDAGERFMIAYLKGIRDYVDAFTGADKAKREEIITILIKYTTLKTRAMYDTMVMPGLDPNGTVNRQPMEDDQKFFISTGYQEKPVNFDTVIDNSFVEKALAKIGK